MVWWAFQIHSGTPRESTPRCAARSEWPPRIQWLASAVSISPRTHCSATNRQSGTPMSSRPPGAMTRAHSRSVSAISS